MDYVILVLGVIIVGFVLAAIIGILRSIFAIPERIQLQREILEELRRINTERTPD